MAQYRKKPIVIEAEQLVVGSEPLPSGVNFGQPRDEPDTHILHGQYWVHTLEGPLIASDGDWIITGVQGERYPCKPDIFEMTYEKVEDPNG